MSELLRRAQKKHQIVGIRGQTLGQASDPTLATETRIESRYRSKIPPECSDFRLAYGNFEVGAGTGEADGPNTIVVRSAMETVSSAGTISQSAAVYPKFFNGSKTVSIDPGAYSVITDSLGLDFAAGDQPYIRSAAEFAAGQTCPVGFIALQGGSAEQAYKNSNAASQIYTTGALAAGTNGTTTTNGYGPLAEIAIPRYAYPGVLVWGDSIPDGQGDTASGDGAGARGYAARGLSLANVPFIKVTRSSDTPAQNKRSTSWRKRALLPFATHVISELGINQIIPTSQAVQLAYLTDIWLSCKRREIKVYQVLVGPQTSSSDSWATPGNQTIDSTFAANRAALNASIVSAYQAGLIDGYFSPSDAWEDPNNLGKFLPLSTTDGTHPTATYHTAAGVIMQAYANANFF